MDQQEIRKIAELEDQILSAKPWQLRGEVGAHSRPANSLLFEEVGFEQTLKTPKITPETTESLESIIKQRIKDCKYDDPIKKTKPIVPRSAARQVEISSEKSKVGLAQLYEQEIVAKVTSEQPKAGQERITERKLQALFRKLDALIDR